jgi:hypothetical protein
MYDDAWWRANSAKVKARLTRAERLIDSHNRGRFEPRKAYNEARAVLELMAEHGYPDWWSRAERLAHDAEFDITHGRALTL